MQVIAGNWRRFVEYSQSSPLGIHLDLLYADCAVQFVFIKFLDSEFSDMTGAGVIYFVHLAQVVQIYTAHIAKRVYTEIIKGIITR